MFMSDSPASERSRQPIQLMHVEERERVGAPLPASLTSLVGREREVREVEDLLRRPDVRLVTLTGPGGVGKTRLALRLAERLAGDFPSGVAFVSLAPIAEPYLVPSAIAHALGVRESGWRPIGEMLGSFLRGRRVLLVLDNFEQVVDAAPSITALLASCPDLKVLVTSRMALRVLGEQEFPVPPLTLPDPDRLPPMAELIQTEAIALFIQRASAVQPDFALTPDTAPIVARICQRLDGLPLAIELAAARSKVLSPAALASRLENRLKVLTSGPKDLPARLQTMRSAIDWSYDLLPADERALFRRLAVFVDGMTLEAAEEIAGNARWPAAPDGDAPSTLTHMPQLINRSVFDGLSSLVDKSLLGLTHGTDGASRFSMLETIREYGLERLAAAGELEEMRSRHAAWFLAMSEIAWPEIQIREDSTRTINRLNADRDNLRAALAWFDSIGDHAQLMQMAGSLFLFCYVAGYLQEGIKWLSRGLAFADASSLDIQARAFLGAGMLSHYADDDARAIPWLEAGLERYRAITEDWGVAFTLGILGIVHEDCGDYERATEQFREALVHARAAGNLVITGLALFHLGIVAWGQGDRSRATSLMQEALEQQRAAGDLAYGASESLGFLGLFAAEEGDYARSAALQRESISLEVEMGSPELLSINVANIAILALAIGRPEATLRLFRTATELRESIANPFKSPEREYYERTIDAARARLSVADATTAWDSGSGRSMGEAASDAFAELDEIERQLATGVPALSSETAASGNLYGLTTREIEVLRQLVAGRSDREIAEALFISPRTAQGHVAHIFTKLNVSSRTAAVVIALQSGVVSSQPAGD